MKKLLKDLIREDEHWGRDSTGMIDTIDMHLNSHIEKANKLFKTGDDSNFKKIVDEIAMIEQLRNLREIVRIVDDIISLERFVSNPFELIKEYYREEKKRERYEKSN